jgi:rSAM/selenodomain-associated transferase 1
MNRGFMRNTTLIAFCREPVPGQTKTRLIQRLGAEYAAELANAFVLDALAKCRRLAPHQIIIAGSASAGAQQSLYFRRLARRFDAQLIDQGAGSLGKRMERALAPFSRKAAVLIGTDTPTLPVDLLARSVALLRRTRVVLAPSLDGGYYLVGVRGMMPDIFRGIAWGRATVLGETLARLRRQRVRHALGPGWYDVDRWSDVISLAAHISGTRPSAIPCPATAAVLRRLGLLSMCR